MVELKIVENGMSEQGWRRVHFMSGDEAIVKGEKEHMQAAIPWESAKWTQAMTYEEAGIWHCKLFWPVRGGLVKVQGLERNPITALPSGASEPNRVPRDANIVLWVLVGLDDQVAEGVEIAAWRYFALFDEWPDTAWVGSEVEMGALNAPYLEVEGKKVKLIQAGWMPRMGVGVGICEGKG